MQSPLSLKQPALDEGLAEELEEAFDEASSKQSSLDPNLEPNIMFLSCISPELCHFKYLTKMAAVDRHLGFWTTGDSTAGGLSVSSNFVLILFTVFKILLTPPS